MEQQLVHHCQSRIVDEKKRSHWCLEWGARNFPQVAAIMCLFGQAKSDLSCLDSNQCLLAGINAFLKAKSNPTTALEGSYLYWDCNNQEWIRSGKAVGSNFNKRHAQHANGSKLTTTASQKSKFYTSYPSKHVQLVDQHARRGKFEDLQMCVGICFKKIMKFKLIDDFETNGGIYHFDKESNKRIDCVRFAGNDSRLQQKQMHMLGHLWELCFDLCLAPSANISGNPGFETPLGIFSVNH